MDQEVVEAQTITRPEVKSEAQENRFRVTVDLLYLWMLVTFYVMSFLYPLFGIVLGAVFMTSSLHPQAKKVGRICLILGIINLVLVIIFFIGFVLVGGLLGRLVGGYYYW